MTSASTIISDESLMHRFQQGDANAFSQLLHRHQRPVLGFIIRQIGDRALAEDLLQDAFTRVIQHRTDYLPKAKFTTWLYTIARNLCIDHGRQKARLPVRVTSTFGFESSPGDILDELPTDGPSTEERVSRQQQLKILEQALTTMNPEHREVFLLRENADLSFSEIAAATETSENTVKSRMRYALSHLREHLNKHSEQTTIIPSPAKSSMTAEEANHG